MGPKTQLLENRAINWAFENALTLHFSSILSISLYISFSIPLFSFLFFLTRKMLLCALD